MSDSLKIRIERLYQETVAKISGLQAEMTSHKESDNFEEAFKCQIKHEELVGVRDRLENVLAGEW